MHLVSHLVAYGLRQVIGESADKIIEAVERRFTDHSQALPKAIARANDRAWQALAVALAGDGWFDSIKVFFTASGDEKGLREEVRRLLEGSPSPSRGNRMTWSGGESLLEPPAHHLRNPFHGRGYHHGHLVRCGDAATRVRTEVRLPEDTQALAVSDR